MKIFQYKAKSNHELKSCCCFHKHKKCPPAVSPEEEKKCELLRERLEEASPFELPDGKRFLFVNQLSGFNMNICPYGKAPTVKELEVISKYLKVNGHPLCPMLVWATKKGKPVLAKVNPACWKSVKVVNTPSLKCQAYNIFVVSDRWITLEPGACYQIASSCPVISAITFVAKTKECFVDGTLSACIGKDEIGRISGINETPRNYTIYLGGLIKPSCVVLRNTGGVAVYVKNIFTS